MKPNSDLSALLKNGYLFEYNMPQYGRQEVAISTHEIGELNLTSGSLLACDLLIVPDARYSFKKLLPVGKYPVILSVADFQPTGETRIASAIIRINEESPVTWEVASLNNPDSDRPDDIFVYGVDSGTGSFMDAEVSEALAPLVWQESGDTYEFEKYCSRVLTEMDTNSFGKYGSAGWANMGATTALDANVITFSSGWGDGAYPSFWGYDESGNLAALATDFDLFFELELPYDTSRGKVNV